MGSCKRTGLSLTTNTDMAHLAAIFLTVFLPNVYLAHGYGHGMWGHGMYGHGHGYGNDGAPNLSALWGQMKDLMHRMHSVESHQPRDNLRDYHDNHNYPHGHGSAMPNDRYHSHQSNGEISSYRSIMKLLHDVGIEDLKWAYGTKPVKSTTYVKRPGSGDTEPAFATMQLMFMKGHFSGIPFNTYEDDRLMMYHNGGGVVLHFFFEDGKHEQHIVGNTANNPEAKYSVLIPGGVYVGTELGDADYAVVSLFTGPAYSKSKYAHYAEVDMVDKFPKYERMIHQVYETISQDAKFDVEGLHAGHDNAVKVHDNVPNDKGHREFHHYHN